MNVQVATGSASVGGGYSGAYAACPAGTHVVGGGDSPSAYCGFGYMYVVQSYPSGNGWYAVSEETACGHSDIVYALCAN